MMRSLCLVRELFLAVSAVLLAHHVLMRHCKSTYNASCCVLPHHPQERTAGLALQQQTGTGRHQQRHGQSPPAAAAPQHQQQRLEVVASLCHHVCVASQQLLVVVLRVVMTAGGMRRLPGEGPLVGATCLLHGVVVVVAAGGDV